MESLKVALEAVKQAKQKLFEKLVDRKMDRETFKEQKVACDRDIETLERKISDTVTAETLAEDKADKMVVAKSFLDITAMTMRSGNSSSKMRLFIQVRGWSYTGILIDKGR